MQVKIYTTPTCPWCKKTKDWFKKKKIPFEELDVSESQNKSYRDEVIEKSGQMSVPVIDIDGEIVVGFNETKLEEAIEKAKEKKPEEEKEDKTEKN